MKRLIKRIAALIAAGCVLAANGLYFTVSADRSDNSGHWVQDGEPKTIIGVDYPHDDYYSTTKSVSGNAFSFSAVCKSEATTANAHNSGKVGSCKGETLDVALALDDPKQTYNGGEEASFTVGLSCSTSQFSDSMNLFCWYAEVLTSFNEPGKEAESSRADSFFHNKENSTLYGLENGPGSDGVWQVYKSSESNVLKGEIPYGNEPGEIMYLVYSFGRGVAEESCIVY